MECALCGKQYKDNELLYAVSLREVVKACESCVIKEKLVVIRRPTLDQLKKAETIIPYYKKVGDTRGSSLVRYKTLITLRQVIDKKYEEQQKQKIAQIGKTPVPDLVDNFHWIIMRVRRAKKITQQQLAKQIGESESAIKMIEEGKLPEDGYKLIKKLEGFFGINLIKKESAKEGITPPEKLSEKQPIKILKFDPKTLNNITISDLRLMKEAKEETQKEEIGFDDSSTEQEKKFNGDV